MADYLEDYPEVLAALEQANAGAMMTVEAIRALARELHRMHNAVRDLRVHLAEMEAERVDP